MNVHKKQEMAKQTTPMTIAKYGCDDIKDLIIADMQNKGINTNHKNITFEISARPISDEWGTFVHTNFDGATVKREAT